MPLFPINPFDLVVGTLFFDVCARLICGHPVLFRFAVGSDGEEGPDDGANHVHPERAFSEICYANPFECLYAPH